MGGYIERGRSLGYIDGWVYRWVNIEREGMYRQGDLLRVV